MNYDPIHDTYDSPKKPLSIDNLVGEQPSGFADDDIDDTFDDDEAKKKRTRRAGAHANKTLRHLKKADGEPFWRKDIQYTFLQELFDDATACFTNSFPPCDVPGANNGPKYTFSELYVRTLAESSKLSKILKERLLKDTDMGKSVSKICLLVNAGRMNTTINFVPEMRLSLRTYHLIPSLQADPVYGGSKPLQDTPRLKSILKAVCEGQEHLKTVGDIVSNPSDAKPNTNVIHLIFLLSNHYHNIPFHYEEDPSDAKSNTNKFMEFFLNAKIHPKNRAKRFLWLMYTYLETLFKPEELGANPFGGAKIPDLELIPDSEVESYDVDTEYEVEYSTKMYNTRLKYLADEEHNNNPKRGNKLKKDREIVHQHIAKVYGALEDDPDTSIDQEEDSPDKRKRKAKRPLTKGLTAPKSFISFAVDKRRKLQGDDSKELPFIEPPIEDLDKIFDKYVSLVPVVMLTEDNPDSVANRINIVYKSKTFIRQVKFFNKDTLEEFEATHELLEDWLFRYFQYKKHTSNGLLAMEWEDIRHDLALGVETYIYQQFGKTFSADRLRHLDEVDDNDGDHRDDTLANVIGEIHASVGSVDYNDIERVGHGYLPIHEFNKANEKNFYLLNLLSYCNDWLVERYNEDVGMGLTKVKFDLQREAVAFV